MNFLHFVREDLKNIPVDYEDALIQNIKKEMEHVKSDRKLEVNYMLFQELIDQERKDAKAEGRIEGKSEGRLEGKAEDILELLSEYGPVPEEIRNHVFEERDLKVLREYLKAVAGAKSMDEFVKIIK